ncbi:ribbon-helix-helix domain-containing protein [Bradyrhizobium diazoefficiens]|uniref:ribbon-helix-helix domain-containing protein n=1 Tax=Bradyrhizobium diazoefficiens TaxID=1355477 RepID=UPI0034860F3D
MKPPNETLSAALAASLDHASDEGFGASAAPSDAEAERCGILVRVSPELRRELKMVAAARDTTVQALLLKAIVAVLEEPATAPTP